MEFILASLPCPQGCLLVPTGGEGGLTQQSADGSSPTLPSPALPLPLPARAPLPARPVGAVRSLLGSQRSRPRFRLVASAWLAPPRAAPRPGAETVQVTFPVWIRFASLSIAVTSEGPGDLAGQSGGWRQRRHTCHEALQLSATVHAGVGASAAGLERLCGSEDQRRWSRGCSR